MRPTPLNRIFVVVVSLLFALSCSQCIRGNQNPLEMPAVGAHQLRLLDPTLLELTLVTTKAPDPAPVTEWNFVGANFAPALPAASEFEVKVGGSTLGVTAVGFKRRPLYAPLKHRDLRIENSLYLRLSSPVPEGQTVTVKNPSGQLWGGDKNFSTTAESTRFNPALHVNQVGYLPRFSKKAMVGYYLGSLGEMPIKATTFNLLDVATGNAVYTGSLVRRADVGYTYTPKPYQAVYEADFTAVQTSGQYVLQVPGMGVSFPFLIHEGTGAAFARTLALGLYHQRCGGKNEFPYTRHEHADCHVAPAQVPTMTFAKVNQHLASMSWDYSNNPRHTAPQLKDVNSSLYPFVNQGTVDVRLGHHDAGDYSKYTINSASLIHHLVFAADSLAGAGGLDNLGLPESGDGKSDLLQEAKWEADFLARMQDADGGFYFLVYPRDRAYEDNVMPENGDPQVVFPKTTAATAAAVGALAEIGSSPRFKQQFPVEAANYLNKAKLGWNFLIQAIATHGKDGAYQKITHYGNEFMHDDELAWAAAALFAATGEAQYHNQLKAWYDPSSPSTRRWSWWRLFEGYGCAARTYAFAAKSGRLPANQLDSTYLAKCQSEIVAAGDDIARFAEQTAYGTSFPDPNKSFRNAGWYFSSERAFEMAVAQQLAPQQRYLDAIISNVNYEGGCNPVNVSYITGLGWKRWREIVHHVSQNDRRVLPPSGLPLGNIQGGFPWLENYKQELGALCFPADGATSAPYPFYDRWGDTFNTTTEFVVVDQARSLGTIAFLMAQTEAAAGPAAPLQGEITGLPASIPAEQPVTAKLSAPGVDLTYARIVWEAKDEEPAFGSQFTFTPKNSGENWVEVEAQLPDGRRIFAATVFTTTFSQSTPPNTFQSTPVSITPEILALYHLDDALTDSAARTPALALAGNARLDNMNLGWMAQRQGTALRVNDLGDKATVTIPGSAIYTSGVTREITLEAMIFVNAFKGYNRGQARIVSMRKGWNASLELMEDTYSGTHLRGGTQFDFFGPALNAAMPLQKWHHLSITIDAAGYSARVNGQVVASAPSTELTAWNGGSISLELGNFDGWIDEVVIRNGRTPQSVVPIAPAAPSALTATALSSTEIALTWADNSSNEEGFRIYRSVDGLNFFEIANTAANSTTFKDNGLNPATLYHYEVVAFSGATETDAAAASAETKLGIPAVPSGVTVQAGDRKAVISWAQSPTATSYTVYRGTNPAGPFSFLVNTQGNSLTNTGLVNGTTYYYAVAAVNPVGVSARSAPVGGTPVTPPVSPVYFLVKLVGNAQIDMTWTDRSGNEDGFEVERSIDGTHFTKIGVLPPNATSFSDPGLAPLTIYYYRVRGFNNGGYSSYSNRSHTKTR